MKGKYLFFLLLLSFPVSLFAFDQPDIEVFSDKEAVAPGEDVKVMVHFRLKPGWHIYWKNPGDSGLPTRVSLKEQDGVLASEVRYAVPEEFRQPGDILGYGYEEEASFLLPFSISENVKTGDSLELKLSLSWLNCSATVCVPGRTERSLSLAVAKESRKSEQQEEFQSLLKSFPSDSEPDLVKFAEGNWVHLTVSDPKASYEVFPVKNDCRLESPLARDKSAVTKRRFIQLSDSCAGSRLLLVNKESREGIYVRLEP